MVVKQLVFIECPGGSEMEVSIGNNSEITFTIYPNSERFSGVFGAITLDEFSTKELVKELKRLLKEINL